MANYNLKCFFTGKDSHGNCVQYRVNFVPTLQNHFPWVEVSLAGDSPVVIKYETIESPFEPIMKSRCTINAVSSDYFFDLYGDDIQHTRVEVLNNDSGELVWGGFLTNNLLNVGQDDCYNNVTLEAIDCLSTLDYLDYAPISGKKQIVSFQDILDDVLLSLGGQIQHVCVDTTMKISGNTYINMSELKISEQNFFSSDTDEPWKKLEVLQEMCRWCGYTAVQWKDTLYLYDRQAHTGMEWTASSAVNMVCMSQLTSFGPSDMEHTNTANTVYCYDINGTNIKGAGSDISLKTIYNTVTVEDNFYEIGDFIPDIYEDDMLENVLGDFWLSEEQTQIKYGPLMTNIPVDLQVMDPVYINKKGNRDMDKNNMEKDFYQRRFKHKWYSTIYRWPHSLAVTEPLDLGWYCNTFQIEGAYHGFTTVYWVYNYTDEDKTVTCTMTCEGYSTSTTHTIPANGMESFYLHILDVAHNFDDMPAIKIGDYGPYVYPDYIYRSYTRGYVAGHIVDLCAVAKGNTSQYNFEPESKRNFDRYVMISQMDEPNGMYSNPRYSGFSSTQLNAFFPEVLTLNSGWTKPIIINDQCYLTINGGAIFERYAYMDYINPDWTKECTGHRQDYNVNYWTLWGGSTEIYTTPPCLVFKLKIGDYWWNGSGWTTTERPFYVDLHTPTDDDGFIDFADWWNDTHEVINNVPWTDFTGVDGYKIPLTGVTFDFNSDIEFSICLPGKIQTYNGGLTHNGMNNYCYIKDFEMGFATKGMENYDLADVIYENVIDEYSVNTLSDITLKFTTYPGEGQHSYSNVGYQGGLIDTCIKVGLDDQANKMEENIIKAYVNQYNTNTIEENMTIDLLATPLSRLKDTENGKYFHVCGMDINLAEGRQTVNMVESKKWSQIEEGE